EGACDAARGGGSAGAGARVFGGGGGTAEADGASAVKISNVRAYVLRCNLGSETFFSSQAPFPARTSCLVRLETDDGQGGWGGGGQGGPPEPVAAMVERVLAPLVVGEDPLRMGVLWEWLYAYTRDWGRQATPLEAISALDIACWDLAGQALGQPVHALLGG